MLDPEVRLEVFMLVPTLAERLSITRSEATDRVNTLRRALPAPLSNDLNFPHLLYVWLQDAPQVKQPSAGSKSIWPTFNLYLLSR